MATQPIYETPMTVEEYLHTVFEHDCEYVDGRIEERDLGEFEHSYVQTLLIGLFLNHRSDWGVYPLAEQRVQTRKTHFRVPDISVLREGSKREPILTLSPFLVIEAQSPDQPLRRTEAKAIEYREFGVEHVWVVDPYSRAAWRCQKSRLELVRNAELTIAGTPIRLELDKLFAELDRP